MYDTLIQHKPGTADLEGGLAESWEHDARGKVWTFKLRQGVKFHDGTAFNAAAVCFNFDRWFNMKGAAAQSQMIYYQDVFGGFAKNEAEGAGQPVYNKCEAKDDGTAVLTLNQYKGAFPGAFALTALSIASPDGAEEVRRRHGQAERRLLRVQRVRQPAPGRHRPVHLRRLGQGQGRDHPEPQPRLLGRQGQGRQADHQDHQGREHP